MPLYRIVHCEDYSVSFSSVPICPKCNKVAVVHGVILDDTKVIKEFKKRCI